MFSKLCKYGFSGVKHLHRTKNNFTLQNVHNLKLITITSRFLSTEDDYFSSFNILDAPTIPEPVSNIVLNTIGEPTFASLGLNNYTPAGLVQFILENAHIHLGLPWWACIIATSVLIKTFMIPVILNQKKAFVRYQSNLQYSSSILTDAIEARKSGDSLLMYEIIKKFNDFQFELRSTSFSILKPILIQFPVFLSAFFALKGMANTPVPSLATGGLWWFTDMTVCDPYYILPLITAGSIALMVELGVEFPSDQGKQIKFFLRCLAPITFVCMSQFPSTLLLYWSCSNIYSLIFAQVLKMPQVKEALNIQDFNKNPTVHNPKNYGLKETMEIINSLSEVLMREQDAARRWNKDDQKNILDRGMAAAAARNQIKESIRKREQSKVDVVGEIIEDKNQKNKM